VKLVKQKETDYGVADDGQDFKAQSETVVCSVKRSNEHQWTYQWHHSQYQTESILVSALTSLLDVSSPTNLQ